MTYSFPHTSDLLSGRYNKEEEKMAHQGSGQAWGKLVKVDGSPDSEIFLINRECTVGRKKGALNIITNNVFDRVNCSMSAL